MEKEKLCFARRHMPAAVESYYNRALQVSRESGVFYRDDRDDCNEWHIDKDTTFNWSKYLENHRWLIANREERKIWSEKSGKFLSIPYRVLTHDEFVELYGSDGCSYRLGNRKWELPKVNTCPGFSVHQYVFCPVTCPGFRVTPVRKTRTKNVYKKVSESVGETDERPEPSQELEQIISKEYQLTAQELEEIDFNTIMEMNIEADRFRGSIA